MTAALSCWGAQLAAVGLKSVILERVAGQVLGHHLGDDDKGSLEVEVVLAVDRGAQQCAVASHGGPAWSGAVIG